MGVSERDRHARLFGFLGLCINLPCRALRESAETSPVRDPRTAAPPRGRRRRRCGRPGGRPGRAARPRPAPTTPTTPPAAPSAHPTNGKARQGIIRIREKERERRRVWRRTDATVNSLLGGGKRGGAAWAGLIFFSLSLELASLPWREARGPWPASLGCSRGKRTHRCRRRCCRHSARSPALCGL